MLVYLQPALKLPALFCRAQNMPSVSQCVYMQIVLASINTLTFNIWGRRTKDNRGDRKTQENREQQSDKKNPGRK